MTDRPVTIATKSQITVTRYHTDDCQAARAIDHPDIIPESEAQARGLSECRICQGDVNQAACDWSYQRALRNAAGGTDD